MNIVAFLSRQSWPMLLLAVSAGLLSGLSGAWLVKLIGDALHGGAPQAGMAWLFFGLCLLVTLAKTGSGLALLRLSQGATLALRVGLARKLLATPFKKLQAIGKAELLAILSSDVATVTQAFQNLPQVFSDTVLIVACLGYMAFLSWQLFLMFAVVLAAAVLLYHLAERVPMRQMRELRQKMDALFKNFRGLIEGSKELQLNAERGHFFVEQVIARDARQFRQLFVAAMGAYTWVSNIGAMTFFLVIGMLLFVLPAWLPLPAELLTKFTLLLLYLIGPITTLSTGLPQIRQAGIALRKIAQLDGALDAPAALAAEPASAAPFASAAPLHLELDAVCHRYAGLSGDSHFMLGPLKLSVRQGEVLFIIGGNGSGKTTLAMLLLGLYEPEAGRIVLNGVPVTPQNLAAYRSHFSAVFADFHLFEHVLGGEQAAVGTRAKAYVEKLGIGHKVSVVDGKFTTTDLSTGQRKRLALVSSYLEDRAVYLFDEWAADQDPVFKQVFYAELLPDLKARGKTVIVITHDDAYFSHADRVVKVADGQLSTLESVAG